MDILADNLPISLACEDLSRAPTFELPAGFSVRWYRPGDGRLWREIQASADRYNEFPPQLFHGEFGFDPMPLGQRQCYLTAPDGETIGSATAWFDWNHAGRRWGRVHWVAILPAWQGRGLGKALMTLICRRLCELGHRRAYLTTSTARLPAVNLYLRFGFLPEIFTEEDGIVWRALEPHLKPSIPWTGLEARSRRLHSGPNAGRMRRNLGRERQNWS